MAELYSADWFDQVLAAADSLPPVAGVSFAFDAEITETPAGKVRAHGRVVDGRLVQFAAGKFVAGDDGVLVEVNFAAKHKRLEPVLAGQVSPLVAYMRGELKVDGAYERVVDQLANQGDRAALEAFRAAVAELSD